MVPAGYLALLGSPEGYGHIDPGEKATMVQLAAGAPLEHTPTDTQPAVVHVAGRGKESNADSDIPVARSRFIDRRR